jgi:hypothetical protein
MIVSRIRKRLTYTNIAMTLILVFVMSGGAYAASKYVITSTKQISPKVLKGLTGKPGKTGPGGAVGATGSTGLAGPAGQTGPAGAKGEVGAKGAQGEPGKPGEPGKDGKEGSPWTAGGTLPVGSTETGEWTVRGTATAEGEFRTTAISFNIPLKEHPGSTTFVKAGDPTPAGCKGNAASPGAESGHLCVFEAEATGVLELVHKGGLTFTVVTNPEGIFNAGTTGGELVFETGVPAKAGDEVSAEGSWAVTG